MKLWNPAMYKSFFSMFGLSAVAMFLAMFAMIASLRDVRLI